MKGIQYGRYQGSQTNADVVANGCVNLWKSGRKRGEGPMRVYVLLKFQAFT